MTKNMKRTGRIWTCPKCGFVLPEAEVPHSAVACHRTQGCRRGNVQMVVSQAETEE